MKTVLLIKKVIDSDITWVCIWVSIFTLMKIT